MLHHFHELSTCVQNSSWQPSSRLIHVNNKTVISPLPFPFQKNMETLISCEPSGLSNTALITVCFWGSDCPHGCKGGKMFDQSSEVVLTCVTLLCCSSFDPSCILCFFLPVTLCCNPTTKQNLPWSVKACFLCHYALDLVITLSIPQPTTVPQCPSHRCFRLLSSMAWWLSHCMCFCNNFGVDLL